MHDLYPFFKKKTRGGTPPPPVRKEKTSPVSRTSISEIGTLKAKITHNLVNRQSAKWAKNAPFAFVCQKCSRGDPVPPPLLREDK